MKDVMKVLEWDEELKPKERPGDDVNPCGRLMVADAGYPTIGEGVKALAGNFDCFF